MSGGGHMEKLESWGTPDGVNRKNVGNVGDTRWRGWRRSMVVGTQVLGTLGGKDTGNSRDAGEHGVVKMQGCWEQQAETWGGVGQQPVGYPRKPWNVVFQTPKHSTCHCSCQEQTETCPVSEQAVCLWAMYRQGPGGG